MINAYSPFHDAPPNAGEKEYLCVLNDHHNKFIKFTCEVIKENGLANAVEIGSYLTNVGFRLKPYLESFLATEVETSDPRTNYKTWACSVGIDVGYNSVSSEGVSIVSDNVNKKYDLFLASEILEHLPHNPLTIVKSIKKYLSVNGVVVVSVPNRMSFSKIKRFVSGNHPYIKFKEFASEDFVLANYGHHWLEYSINDLDYVFECSGFKRIKYSGVNNIYKKKLPWVIKNILKHLSFNFVYDQIYAAYKLKDE